MLLKNTGSQGVYLYEYIVATGLPKTGDAANITGSYTLDGTDHAGFTTANPTEIGGGVYWQPLAQGETNANIAAYRWASTTSGVQINPVFVLTTGAGLPAVAPGAANGLFIAGTNAATTITTSLTTAFTGNLTGSVGSVAGAVGSVTGAVGSVTAAVTLPAIPANWITAAGITAAALNGKGDWSTYAGGDTAGTTTLVGLLTPTRAGYLDAAISSRSTYAGGAVASVTGAVGSVTAAVTLPAIPANWITAAGINAAALAGKGDWLLSSGYTAPPTVGAIDTQLSGTHGAGAGAARAAATRRARRPCSRGSRRPARATSITWTRPSPVDRPTRGATRRARPRSSGS